MKMGIGEQVRVAPDVYWHPVALQDEKKAAYAALVGAVVVLSQLALQTRER